MNRSFQGNPFDMISFFDLESHFRSWGAGYGYNNKMGLVIAGGFDDGFGGVAYVDGTKNGIKFEPMTPLPTTPQYSCLASVDDETLFLTGGSNNGEFYDQALLYRYMLSLTCLV